MSALSQYGHKYRSVRMERRDGILQMTLHTNGGSLQWSLVAHSELPDAFADVGNDPDNRVVILTGCGDEFSGPRVVTERPQLFHNGYQPEVADRIIREGKALLMNLLNIDVPVISAINGPAWRHGELPLLADVVLASDTVRFQDSAHFQGGLVPGDGMHIVMPLLLGMNRGRYFLLTGEVLDAQKALQLGLVAEVLPANRLLDRAWEIAAQIARRPVSLVRHTRAVLTEQLKRQVQELLGFGLYAEMMALAAPDNRSPQTVQREESMMLFMLKIDVSVPPEMPAADKDALRQRENARAAELIEQGTLVRIWRIVGRVANYSVWQTASLDALHDVIQSMPMFPYMKIDVTPLVNHPMTEVADKRNGRVG